MVGSIGTQFSMMDFTEALKERGYKRHDIRATKSTDKNQEYFDILKGDYGSMIKNYLDPLNEVFITTVEKYRNVGQEVTTGKTYFGKTAIEVGLADSIGNLDDAITKAKELSINSQNETEMSFFKNIFAKKSEEAKAEGKELTTEELEQAAEQEVEQMNAEIEKLRQENEALAAMAQQSKDQQNRLLKENETLSQQKQQLEQENEELGKKTVTQPVQTDKNKDVFEDVEEKVPVLDIEEEVIQRGIKVDNTSFKRVKGIIL
jgi:protease-4